MTRALRSKVIQSMTAKPKTFIRRTLGVVGGF